MLRLVLQTDATPSEGKIDSVEERLLQLPVMSEDRLTRLAELPILPCGLHG